ncbi:VanZ family protein [Streptomyces sp. NPDC059637]|uniref:VanZ family protein n=1 Tax=Streptomyces sp. NPDC059637 TaxID=3347752 RepID=UPI00369B512A
MRTGSEQSVRTPGAGARSAFPAARAAGVVLTVAWLALVGWLRLRPVDVPWVYGANFDPLATIRRDLALGPARAVRSFASGLALLAPLGFLLPLAGGRARASAVASFVRTLLAGWMIAFALACAQTWVPGRVFDIDQLMLNTAGIVVAHLAVVPAVRGRLRRRAGAARVGDNPEKHIGGGSPRGVTIGAIRGSTVDSSA